MSFFVRSFSDPIVSSGSLRGPEWPVVTQARVILLSSRNSHKTTIITIWLQCKLALNKY